MHQGKTNPSALDYKTVIKHFPIEVLQDYRGRTSNSRIVAYKIRCSQEWKQRGRESSTPYNLQWHFLAYLQPTKLTGSIPLAELSRAIQEHTL